MGTKKANQTDAALTGIKAVNRVEHDGVIYEAGDEIPFDAITDVQLKPLEDCGAVEVTRS